MTHSGSAWLGLISDDGSVFSTQRGARKQSRGYEAFLEREHQELLSQTWRKMGLKWKSGCKVWAAGGGGGDGGGQAITHFHVATVKSGLIAMSLWSLWSSSLMLISNPNSQEIKEMLNLKRGQQRDTHMHMQMGNAPPFSHPCLCLHGFPPCSTRSHVEGLRFQISTQSKRLDWSLSTLLSLFQWLCDPHILIFPLNCAASMCGRSLSLLLVLFFFFLSSIFLGWEHSSWTCQDEGIAVDTVSLLLWDWTCPPLSSNVTIKRVKTPLIRASPLLHLCFTTTSFHS